MLVLLFVLALPAAEMHSVEAKLRQQVPALSLDSSAVFAADRTTLRAADTPNSAETATADGLTMERAHFGGWPS